MVFGDSDECAAGAAVTVLRDGVVAGEATTDIFGEVAVDHLDPGHEYVVRIAADGYSPAELTVRIDASLNAGTVFLEKLETGAGARRSVRRRPDIVAASPEGRPPACPPTPRQARRGSRPRCRSGGVVLHGTAPRD